MKPCQEDWQKLVFKEKIVLFQQNLSSLLNPDYDLVIDRLHLHYDMLLVKFGIDKDKNHIIQFPVFIQPEYTGTVLHEFTGQ